MLITDTWLPIHKFTDINIAFDAFFECALFNYNIERI